jgi:hypothetical protein
MQPIRKSMALTIAMAMVLSLVCFAPAARAADIYVNAGDDLQAAINAASSGDTIYVAEGTFYGGFSVAGKALTIVGTAADPANWDIQTVLDGGNAQTVMFVAPNADLTLSGLVIQNGFSGPLAPGGGVMNLGALTLSQCLLTGCRSPVAGGAVLNAGTLLVDRCLFEANGGRAGAAISNGGQFPSASPGISAVVTNSVFAGGSSLNGAAIWNAEQLVMVNDLLVSNSAAGFGGALVNINLADVYNCTFTMNSANVGGAIVNGLQFGTVVPPSTLNVTNSILWDDSALSDAPEIGCHPAEGIVATLAYSDVEGGVPERVTDGGGNIDADPQLSEDLLGLADTSPCINAGDNRVVSAVNGYPQVAGQYVDILGNPRISGGVVDMGAAEFQSAPSSLTISDVTVMVRNDKVVTVTVQIGNPNEATAYDVTVTAATLDGSSTNSTLPLVYGAIKPGESKKCTLQFKNVGAGEQTLALRGTSSLGDFFTAQTVTVP